MDKLKTPASDFEAEARGSENKARTIIAQRKQMQPTFMRVGGHQWEEAPAGTYI